MGITQNSNDETLLIKLEKRLEQGHKFLNEDKIHSGPVCFWIVGVRALLNMLYGTQSPELSLFSQIEGKPSERELYGILNKRVQQLEFFLNSAKDIGLRAFGAPSKGKIFIGHGHSPIWRELKDFISERLGLPWDEFNREAIAGITTFDRLSQMLNEAVFAFLIMTAEEEHSDSKLHARQNVVHEVGLFQGRLGPRKAIILLAEGCSEFSNIVGLSQIRFPDGNISAVFEDIRRVLEREEILQT